MQTQINIKLLFFGLLRDLFGTGRMELTIDYPSNVSDVLSQLRELYPQPERLNLLHAVNETYVDDQTMLNDGDELAIFTAVSGG